MQENKSEQGSLPPAEGSNAAGVGAATSSAKDQSVLASYPATLSPSSEGHKAMLVHKAAAKSLPAKKSRASLKPRRKKPPGMPTRPLSAYNFFFREERMRWLEKTKNEPMDDEAGGVFGAMGRAIAKRWRELSSDETVRFHELATQDAERYAREMDAYHSAEARLERLNAAQKDATSKRKSKDLKKTPIDAKLASSAKAAANASPPSNAFLRMTQAEGEPMALASPQRSAGMARLLRQDAMNPKGPSSLSQSPAVINVQGVMLNSLPHQRLPLRAPSQLPPPPLPLPPTVIAHSAEFRSPVSGSGPAALFPLAGAPPEAARSPYLQAVPLAGGAALRPPVVPIGAPPSQLGGPPQPSPVLLVGPSGGLPLQEPPGFHTNSAMAAEYVAHQRQRLLRQQLLEQQLQMQQMQNQQSLLQQYHQQQQFHHHQQQHQQVQLQQYQQLQQRELHQLRRMQHERDVEAEVDRSRLVIRQLLWELQNDPDGGGSGGGVGG